MREREFPKPPFLAARPGDTRLRPARTPFVGRAQEVAAIAAALTRAQRGQGSAVFLSGETGIGKSRLAQEVLDLARGRGFQALKGHAYALETTLAYGSIIAAFGPCLRRLDRPRLLALTSGLPDLGRLFSDLLLPAPLALGDAALEKTRLFEAVARLLDRLARQTPVVFFVDDLHWADPASLELLHYLGRGLAQQPILLLGTYRSDEVEGTRELRVLRHSLRQLGLASELTLDRLGRDDVVALVRGALGGEPAPDLVDSLAGRGAGTPLFVEALLRDLLESDQLVRTEAGWGPRTHGSAPPPGTVREVILERLRRLDPTSRRVVDLLAVSGGATPHAILSTASGLDEDALLAALQGLRAASLITEKLTDRRMSYAASHPLIQEVAYAELAAVARHKGHAAFATALERLHPEDIERLAYHYRGAGGEVDPDRALEIFLAASERAKELYANEEAVRHFGAALTLVREGRRRDLLPVLLERLAEAWEQLGEGGAAVALWTEAVTEHTHAGDTAAIARLRHRLALAEWDRGHFDAAQAHLEAGFEMFIGATSPELADLLHARVVILGRLADEAGVAAATDELLAVAERLGSSRAHLEAELAAANLDVWRGAYTAARERALRAVPAAAVGEPLLEQRLHDLLAIVAFASGEHRVLRAHAERSLELARRLGAPTLEIYPNMRLVQADLLAGRWDDALSRSADAVVLARRIGHARGLAGALAIRAMVLTLRGELDGAQACIAEARTTGGPEFVNDRNIFAFVDTVEATLALERGDLGRAGAAAAVVAGAPGVPSRLGQALLAEVQALAGDARGALDGARAIVALDADGCRYLSAVAARLEGLAHRAAGEANAALVCLTRAAEAFAALDLPFEAARARLERATVAGVEAAAATQEALETFTRLGARRYADRARRLLRELGVRPAPPRRRRSADGGLSPREQEVARLVAEGLTTRQIAERLVVSARTVTTHLEHVYARLGINSRNALVRYVLEGHADT